VFYVLFGNRRFTYRRTAYSLQKVKTLPNAIGYSQNSARWAEDGTREVLGRLEIGDANVLLMHKLFITLHL
jgi:hypothetical protein